MADEVCGTEQTRGEARGAVFGRRPTTRRSDASLTSVEMRSSSCASRGHAREHVVRSDHMKKYILLHLKKTKIEIERERKKDAMEWLLFGEPFLREPPKLRFQI